MGVAPVGAASAPPLHPFASRFHQGVHEEKKEIRNAEGLSPPLPKGDLGGFKARGP